MKVYHGVNATNFSINKFNLEDNFLHIAFLLEDVVLVLQ